ncbi:TPA: P-type DNA transfer protein VirB5 [Acinetobacter baumannii]|nr:P-type DNA transfer protein VirB5 [Acinetobacter baumannii]HAV4560643.1 P-type DNA transfer protein VirB5 [Acinetobacter baumannii]HAV4584089.1 P-type DNA transfer protein VirB5 [Acinetobacter baumannii]
MKKQLLALGLGSSLFISGQANATGIPVIDGANLVQAVQNMVAWGEQYNQMVNQIQQAKQQYDSITGIRGFGDAVNNPYLKDVIPSDVADIYKGIQQGGVNGMTSAARNIRDATMVYDCASRTGQNYKACQAALNNNAQTQALNQQALGVADLRTEQIDNLRKQINNTTDAKAIAELQARIQAEQSQVANDANRIALMQAQAQAQKDAAQQLEIEGRLKRAAQKGNILDGYSGK